MTDSEIDDTMKRLVQAFEHKIKAEVRKVIQFQLYLTIRKQSKYLVTMKKIALILVGLLVGFFSYSQESVVKVSGLDAVFGMYEVSYERTFNEGMNNIKSSGRLRPQGKWPNILTKGSITVFVVLHQYKQSQSFGDGLTAVIDTNSNYDFNNVVNGFQVIAESTNHSVARQAVTKVTGFGFGIEYRSYIKTYSQILVTHQEVGILLHSLTYNLPA